MELFEGGDESCHGIAALLEKVQKPDQLPIYYTGGFKLIAAAITKSVYILTYSELFRWV